MGHLEIKSWLEPEKVLFAGEAKSIKDLLQDAVLRGAVLRGADLQGADLRGAVLRGADLRDADLRGAVLRGADLRYADLRGADLRGADLQGVDLTPIRDDFWAVLCSVPSEVVALRESLVAGHVDGSTYTGECACLVGTIANAKGCNYKAIPGLSPDPNRPAERFFLVIKRGDTPEMNPFSRIAIEWIDEFVGKMSAAFGAKQ